MAEAAHPKRPTVGARLTVRWQKLHNWQALVLGTAIGMGVLGVGGLAIGGPLLLTHRSNWPFELAYGRGVVSIASRLESGTATNPVAGGRKAIRAGALAYTGSCAVCHGGTGHGDGMYTQALYPPATNLTSHDARQKSDAQLYWIIKNGLSFTGMPSFAGQYNSQQIWSIVAYLRTLQGTGQSSPNTLSPVQEGQGLYVADGCQICHGTPGASSGELTLRKGGAETTRAIRQGRRGMPAYSTAVLSDRQISAIEAYINAAASGSVGRRGN
ncbi:MAG: c-type cytochrome [Chloroflexi bacterium]|nr:c-type cytochrome [Chloroflexota bacterium]